LIIDEAPKGEISACNEDHPMLIKRIKVKAAWIIDEAPNRKKKGRAMKLFHCSSTISTFQAELSN
jgi:hypothetical protein